VRFRVLGPVEVVDGDEHLALGGASQRALLAMLLLHTNEVVSNDRLLDALWEHEPPGSGLAALRVRVSQLRKALGSAAERLETAPSGYRLRVRPDELDLDHFTRLVEESERVEPAVAGELLRAALALWRGPPLSDVTYASFAQAAIGRMNELRLAAVERRIEADLALGRHAELVGELEAHVKEHPFRERLRSQLMLALYRSGRQAEALGTYQAARRTLVEEFGIEPSPLLRQLEAAILRQTPELDLARSPVLEPSILVVSLALDRIDALLALAEPLARRPAKELILARLVPSADRLGEATETLQQRRAGLLARGISTRAAAFVSSAPARDVVRMAVEQDVDLLVVDGPPQPLRGPVLSELLVSAPCDVAVVAGGVLREGPVLVPFVGAEHDWSAIELGAWLAGALDVPLRLAGPRDSSGGGDASRLLANASLAVQATLGIATVPLLLEPTPAALQTAAGDAAAVVVGLSDRWRTEGLGGTREALTNSKAPIVLVRRGLRPGGLAPSVSLTRFTWTLRS
jgi:DNA-binding SARP family transcriptional activator